MNELSTDIKEVMRESAREIVEIFLLENHGFRIVMWNNDNWDRPLPDNIMESFRDQIVLDIKEAALEDSYIDESSGEIILVSSFSGEEYSKILLYSEIVAVLDFDGQPYIINNFTQDELHEEESMHNRFPASKEDWINMAVEGGIPEENAQASINAFIKNNPDIIKEN